MRDLEISQEMPASINLQVINRKYILQTLQKSEATIAARLQAWEEKKANMKGRTGPRRKPGKPVRQTNIFQKILANLNVLSQGNFEKKSQELASYINANAENTDLLEETVKLLLRKAATDKLFCSLYSRLCLVLIRSELTRCEMSTTASNFRKTRLHKILMTQTRSQFDDFAAERGFVDDQESNIKLEIRYQGSMRFLAHLTNDKILSISALASALCQLLLTKEGIYTERHVEGVCNAVQQLSKSRLEKLREKFDVIGALVEITKENSTCRASILVLNLLDQLNETGKPIKQTAAVVAIQPEKILLSALKQSISEAEDMGVSEYESWFNQNLSDALRSVEINDACVAEFLCASFEMPAQGQLVLVEKFLPQLLRISATWKSSIRGSVQILQEQTDDLEIDFPNVKVLVANLEAAVLQ